MHQLGQDNNMMLWIRMGHCENLGKVELDGEQHDTFETTLPNTNRKAGALRSKKASS